jgi:hypothetical protein
VREVKSKVLGIAVTLLLAAMFVAPVFAAPATKIEGVTLTPSTTLIPESTRAVDHNIVHNEGTAVGTATLNIPDQDSLHFDYYGTWSGTAKWTGFPNPDPEGSNVVRSMVVLTCTDEGITGTFEGMLHTKTIGLPPVPGIMSYTETHMVLHGTGDFQGQTLQISYAGAPPALLAGTLIIPK